MKVYQYIMFAIITLIVSIILYIWNTPNLQFVIKNYSNKKSHYIVNNNKLWFIISETKDNTLLTKISASKQYMNILRYTTIKPNENPLSVRSIGNVEYILDNKEIIKDPLGNITKLICLYKEKNSSFLKEDRIIYVIVDYITNSTLELYIPKNRLQETLDSFYKIH